MLKLAQAGDDVLPQPERSGWTGDRLKSPRAMANFNLLERPLARVDVVRQEAWNDVLEQGLRGLATKPIIGDAPNGLT